MKRVTVPRPRTKTVKLRTNGHNKIDAKSTIKMPTEYGPLGRILRPQVQFRWLMPNIGAITPQYIEMVLMGAMMGNNVQMWALFDLMLKTWPELLACYDELIFGVLRKKLMFEPYCDEDEEPTPSAIERSKLCSAAIRRMQPDFAQDDCAIEGTIKDILDAWFRGLAVSEIAWNPIEDSQLGTIIAPKATYWVDPVYYGLDTTGRVGMRANQDATPGKWPFFTTSVQPSPSQLVEFPPNKFLISINKASSGAVLTGPLLRPLAWWWCAANFSSDWLLNLAQVFGLPFRWANYDQNAPQATIDAICTMLQNMGSAGWAAFPTGTTLELVQPTGSQGSDHSPQGELLDRADRYARMLILGQTMTGSHGTTGKGGGQAFGEVEIDVKHDRIEAAGDFAASVINSQLIPYILTLNYGDTEESPTFKFLEDKEAGLAEAQRDQVLIKMGLPVGENYLYKKYDVPKPAEGEETVGGGSPMPPGFGGFGQQDNFGNQGTTPNDQPQEPDQTPQDDAMQSGDQVGHEFHGNQYSKEARNLRISDSVDHETLGRGTVLKVNEKGALVSFQGLPKKMRQRWIAHSELKRIPFTSMDLSDEEFAAAKKHAAQLQDLHAGDAPGHPFRGNQHVKVGDYVQTPNGRGMIVAPDGPNSSFVSVNGGIRSYPHTQLKKIPYDHSRFPSIRQSAEDERRAELNKQIAKVAAIQDDAVFAMELLELHESISAAGDKPGHEFHGNQFTRGTIFRHKNGNKFVVHSPVGSFYDTETKQPIPGKFGARSLKDGKAHGPMRDMHIKNVAEILPDKYEGEI